ncbi:MAG: helix-turn-helix domain-containing protein [Clostridia bacterium]|nr:helix-turn-helix domain-containing protein [Clostridia bacterium]
MESGYLIFENSIGDLRISSIADQGFYKHYAMSPELHTHSYYEILFSLEGGFFLNLSDGMGREIPVGSFCLIPPGMYHGTRAGGTASQKLALRFRYTKDTEGREGESLYERFHRVLKEERQTVLFFEDAEIVRCMELLRDEIGSPGIGAKEYIESVLSRLYLLLMRKLCERDGQSDEKSQVKGGDEQEKRRLQSEEYFQQYYTQPITEDHMAERMCLSRRQLSRVLREIYGKSFRQLLIEERLNRAAQLLLTTDQSVEEIAFAVGYTSLSGFYTAFRQSFGISAGRYRKEFLKIQ